MWETSLQNRQILENLLGIIKIFCFLKSDFPHTKFDFLQRLSAFFNGFPIIRENRENPFTAASIQKITIQASYFPPLAPQAS
jgi:hypothetical protein